MQQLIHIGSLGTTIIPTELRSTTTTSSSLWSDDDTDDYDNDDNNHMQRYRIEMAKSRLVQLCETQATTDQIRDAMIELEMAAAAAAAVITTGTAAGNRDDTGANQVFWTNRKYDLMNGEWELLYTPVDDTRSSPFFWAFRKAFPNQSDPIFRITDAIPTSIKQIGPVYQEIIAGTNIETASTTQPQLWSGTFVSRVKVATLGGIATSIMTTRASIIGREGNDGMRLKIETTKPEQSTIIEKLFGPLSATISDALPPFPSGDTLEQIVPGSSEVVMCTTFCDETLRISKNNDRMQDEYFIWQRKSFATYDVL
jgi:hypothetical protein